MAKYKSFHTKMLEEYVNEFWAFAHDSTKTEEERKVLMYQKLDDLNDMWTDRYY